MTSSTRAVLFDAAFVDALALAELGFEGVEPAATGRPSYHPSVLLTLYICGCLNRVQSSRRLEREAGRNVVVMWLLGVWCPTSRQIADFRKDNGAVLRKVGLPSPTRIERDTAADVLRLARPLIVVYLDQIPIIRHHIQRRQSSWRSLGG